MKISSNNTLLYISIALAVLSPIFLFSSPDKKDPRWYVGPPVLEFPKTDQEFLTRIDHIDRIKDPETKRSEVKRFAALLVGLPIERLGRILLTPESNIKWATWSSRLRLCFKARSTCRTGKPGLLAYRDSMSSGLEWLLGSKNQ